jgi:hypothetical protein
MRSARAAAVFEMPTGPEILHIRTGLFRRPASAAETSISGVVLSGSLMR